MSAQTPEYHLIYWPGLPGRGEFIRLLFEWTGTPYTDIALTSPEEAVSKVSSLKSSPSPSDILSLTSPNPACFAPPFLVHNDVILNQVPSILQYLALKLNLAPKVGSVEYHQVNSIVLTLLDAFVVELHDTHHPIAIEWAYEDQKEEGVKRGRYYAKNRVPAFLGWLERVVKGEGRWVYGEELTYADLVMFQCIHGTSFAFPKTMAKMREGGDYASVFEIYDRIAKEPKIEAYLGSERRQAYGNGIWRHYPEMEKDD